MPHIAEGDLLAYLDGELSWVRRSAISEHLDACKACAAELASLEGAAALLSQALEAIEVPAPQLDSSEIKDRSRWISRFAGSVLFKAAVLVLTLGGVGAAAIPGSPVRDWLARSLIEVRGALGLASDAETTALEPQPGVAATSDVATITVSPADGQVVVRLTTPAADATVRVQLVDSDQATVRSRGARYRTGPGWIEVVNAEPGALEIDLPRALRAARVELNGRPIVIKDAATLRLLTAPDSTGSAVVFRVSE